MTDPLTVLLVALALIQLTGTVFERPIYRWLHARGVPRKIDIRIEGDVAYVHEHGRITLGRPDDDVRGLIHL